MARIVIQGNISTVIPNDSTPVYGSSLLVLVAGNLALKGLQTNALALTAFAVTVGQQFYIPGQCIVMATGTTATVAVLG